ncbi:MAG: TIGR03621 family F420-dependent LLM class oxidoreductase [Caldilineaceae bacterium]
MHQRPFRFGLATVNASSRKEWIERGCKAMDLGYTTLSIADHFQEQLAPFSALMAIADACPSLRIGSYVFANDFRHPAVLAKEVATLDLLSECRVEFGIGAGWLESDYMQTGMPFDRPGIRVSRLKESLSVIKRLFHEEPVTFTGTYHKVSNLVGYPKPFQKPHPPIMIGAHGRRMLALAAEEADIISLIDDLSNSQIHFASDSLATTAEKLEWVRQQAGARFPQIEFNVLIWSVVITDNQQQGAEQLAARMNLTNPQQVLNSPNTLVGTVEQLCETIYLRREQLGISYYTITDRAMERFAPVVAKLAGR